MKISTANVLLRLFATFASGVIGVAFSAGPLSVLPYNIRVHGLVSFIPLMGILISCAGIAVVVLSISVGLRRKWAHDSLVHILAGLTIVFVIAVGRKVLQEGSSTEEHMKVLSFGSCVVVSMVLVVLLLLNRRIQDQLEARPNQSSQPTPLKGG